MITIVVYAERVARSSHYSNNKQYKVYAENNTSIIIITTTLMIILLQHSMKHKRRRKIVEKQAHVILETWMSSCGYWPNFRSSKHLLPTQFIWNHFTLLSHHNMTFYVYFLGTHPLVMYVFWAWGPTMSLVRIEWGDKWHDRVSWYM